MRMIPDLSGLNLQPPCHIGVVESREFRKDSEHEMEGSHFGTGYLSKMRNDLILNIGNESLSHTAENKSCIEEGGLASDRKSSAQ